MAEIFSNAYLTVAAAQGSSCNDTFLERDVFQAEVTVPIRNNDIEAGKCLLGLRFRRPGTDKMSEISQSRWITRGWTFQEERLARRLLIFGEKKIFFHCRTLERAEDLDAYKIRPHWVDSVIGSSPEGEAAATQEENISNSTRSEYDHWRGLCRHYTRRSLTCADDKLPAISGMASLIAKGQTSEYLAGLWRSDFTHDLFWYPTGQTIDIREYRAPSWSWASLDGPITWFDSRTCAQNGCQMHCTILNVWTKPLGLDPLGAIVDGHLKIVGQLLKVDASWTGDPNRYQWRLDFGSKEVARAIPDRPIKDIQSNSTTQSFWALLFATCNDDARQKQRPRGLVLEDTGRKRETLDEFQRVGVFKILYPPSSDENKAIAPWKFLDRRTIVIV
jgi:hypothetical protein